MVLAHDQPRASSSDAGPSRRQQTRSAMKALRPLSLAGPLGQAGAFALVACLAAFFGLVSAFLPPMFIFSVLLVPALAVVLLVRPEYALASCVALVCGLVHPALVPRIPVFGGSLAAADAILAMLVVYAIVYFATTSDKTPAPPVPGAGLLASGLGLFGVCSFIALCTSLLLRELNRAHVLGEARDLLYLLMLPIAVVILRPRQRQERFVRAVVVLGCLFCVGQVLQGVFNLPVFGAQGMSALETLGRQDDGTTRANTLGLNVIIYALLLTVGAYLLGSLRARLFFPVAGLLLLGIILTFGRTTFAAVLVCLVIVAWWLNPRRLPGFAAMLLLGLLGMSALWFSWKPDSFDAVVYRMTSIRAEIDHGYSAQWRIWEAQAMLPQIEQHPLLGIGLGADYKGQSGSTTRSDLNRYVHNGYLYMAGKMGLPALMAFLLSLAAIFSIGRRTAKSSAAPWARIIGAAGAAMMIRFLLASITEPHFMSDYGLVVIAIAGALVYLSAAWAKTPGVEAGAQTPSKRSNTRLMARERPARRSTRAAGPARNVTRVS
jgi:O-antigen ligase